MREPRLFVHCGTSFGYAAELARMVPGIERVSERALLLAMPGDIVCLTHPVEADYLAYLAELGLGPSPEHVVVLPPTAGADEGQPLWQRVLVDSEALARIARLAQATGATRIEPFIAVPGQLELAAALAAVAGVPFTVGAGEPGIVAEADRKDRMRERALSVGVPVADGELVELPFPGGRRRRDLDRLRDAIHRRMGRTGRVIVRGALGASGSSTFVIGRDGVELEPVLQRLAGRTDNRTYLVEAMVDATVSPNVQLHVAPGDGVITCVGVSDQRWGRPLAHAGNLFPSSAETVDAMVCHARVLASSLQRDGYHGFVGFDFVEYRGEGGAPRALLAEVNPRVNGASYPLAVRERIDRRQRVAGLTGVPAFLSGSVSTRAKNFGEVRDVLGDLLFTPARGHGIIPYNLGFLDQGRLGVVVLGDSRDSVARLFTEARHAARHVLAVSE